MVSGPLRASAPSRMRASPRRSEHGPVGGDADGTQPGHAAQGDADGTAGRPAPGRGPQGCDAEEADAPETTANGGQDTVAFSRGPSPEALSPQAWQAVRYAIARLAVELVSGPAGLAATLRQGLLPAPYNSKPVILDIGYSDQIPGSIRRAVALRARHCEWPGCRKRPAACDVHHLRHKADGGETSIRNCVLLCQFHHDVCIHRWSWRLVLHPDGTTTAYGPKGQVIHSHGPPGSKGSPGDKSA
jgi:hypothetical protein